VSLYFSEYVEGGSYNKALEIRNPGTQVAELGTCAIRNYPNGASTPNVTVNLAGTIAPGGVFVVCNPGASEMVISLCDLTANGIAFNGDDAVQLVCGGESVDVIGQIGYQPPASGWGFGSITTANATLRRRCGVTAGDPDGSDPFSPDVEWIGLPEDTFAGLGSPACAP
jgi:predicted extracellular nuclease